MKFLTWKSIYVLSLCCVMVVVSGCTNQFEEEMEQNMEKEWGFETFTRASISQELQYLAELGYDISRVLVTPSFYILEGKFKIDRQCLHLVTDRQSQSMNVILHPHYRKIGIVPVYGQYDGTSHLSEAIDQWNYMDCDVKFSLVTNNCSEEFPVRVYWDFNDYDMDPENPSDLVILGVRDAEREDVPIESVSINIGHGLWDLLSIRNAEDYCCLHALARVAGFPVMETYDQSHCSIFDDPIHYYQNSYIFCGISSVDETYIESVYGVVSTEPYTYYWGPDLGGSEQNILLQNKDYSLSLNNDSGCCVNTDVWMKISVFDDCGNNVTTSVVSDDTITINENFLLNFDQVGQYIVNLMVYDEYIGSVWPIHRLENIAIEVRGNHFTTECDNIVLNQPYDVTYHYWNPECPNATIEYSINEVLFQMPEDVCGASLSQSNNSATVQLSQNGCYYVTAVVKNNGIPIDTAYCNLTKLIRLPETEDSIIISQNSVNGVASSSIELDLKEDPIQLATYIAEEYNYGIEINNCFGLGRFACLVESEYENRNNFVIDNSIIRRIDRQWFMRLHSLTASNIINTSEFDLPTLYLLYNTEPNDQGFVRWRYEYYTGKVYCPLDGIREVDDLKVYNLPMQTVEANCVGFTKQRVGFGYEE